MAFHNKWIFGVWHSNINDFPTLTFLLCNWYWFDTDFTNISQHTFMLFWNLSLVVHYVTQFSFSYLTGGGISYQSSRHILVQDNDFRFWLHRIRELHKVAWRYTVTDHFCFEVMLETILFTCWFSLIFLVLMVQAEIKWGGNYILKLLANSSPDLILLSSSLLVDSFIKRYGIKYYLAPTLDAWLIIDFPTFFLYFPPLKQMPWASFPLKIMDSSGKDIVSIDEIWVSTNLCQYLQLLV